jgi:hypothetical protein
MSERRLNLRRRLEWNSDQWEGWIGLWSEGIRTTVTVDVDEERKRTGWMEYNDSSSNRRGVVTKELSSFVVQKPDVSRWRYAV